jgi:hypothetical protein
LYNTSVPEKIYNIIPNCKFIVILRNPVDRSYSQYCRFIQRTGKKYTFKEYVTKYEDVMKRGFYYTQIKRYLNFFPIDNFLFLIFEEAMSNPRNALEKIAGFFSIDINGFDLHQSTQKVNPSYKVRYPAIQKIITGLVTFLQHYDLYWIMSIARFFGFKRVCKKDAAFRELDPDVRKELMKTYDPDIHALEKLLKKDLSSWRK